MLSPAHCEFLKTLSSKRRAELMLLLLKKPMNVKELSQRSSLEQSAVSHHLKRLKLCAFVKMQKKGKQHIYSVNEDTIGPLFRLMDKHVKKYCCHVCRPT